MTKGKLTSLAVDGLYYSFYCNGLFIGACSGRMLQFIIRNAHIDEDYLKWCSCKVISYMEYLSIKAPFINSEKP